MRLKNLRFPGEEVLRDIWVQNGIIAEVRNAVAPAVPAPAVPALSAAPSLDFGGAIVFPGLINSHDHLDFNLYPLIGNKVYRNYTEWGEDIHSNNKSAIRPIRQIPQRLRTQWGIYKNLLNGFTTVVNHGEHLDIPDPLIAVFQDYHCLHSVGFEPRWKWKLNHPARTGRPFVLHVGEGTDAAASLEIDELIRWNLFRRPLVGVHGVAMTDLQAEHFHALVWCPASNYFLLGRTAPVDSLLAKVPILFGTDSTLTAGWNAWDQIRQARGTGLATDSELLAMLTTAPAAAWSLPGRGTLEAGSSADLVIARPLPGLTGMDAFYSLNPENLLLVLHEGQIRLFDDSLLEPITGQGLTGSDFQPARPGGKYVGGDLPGLMAELRSHCPGLKFPPMP